MDRLDGFSQGINSGRRSFLRCVVFEKKRGRPFTPEAAMSLVTVVIYRNSVEVVCSLRLVKLNNSSVCYAAIEMAQ